MTLYKLSGYVSLAMGIVCCLLLINPRYMFFALLSAITGFIFATINIYHNTKYEHRKMGMGYISIVLCSVPVIVLMYFIFRS